MLQILGLKAKSQQKERDMYLVGITTNAGVRGKAKQYSYRCAALYKAEETKDGYKVWKRTGLCGPARRGHGVLMKDAAELAEKYNCRIVHGSPHNMRVEDTE
jgi:hypothetical protein